MITNNTQPAMPSPNSISRFDDENSQEFSLTSPTSVDSTDQTAAQHKQQSSEQTLIVESEDSVVMSKVFETDQIINHYFDNTSTASVNTSTLPVNLLSKSAVVMSNGTAQTNHPVAMNLNVSAVPTTSTSTSTSTSSAASFVGIASKDGSTHVMTSGTTKGPSSRSEHSSVISSSQTGSVAIIRTSVAVDQRVNSVNHSVQFESSTISQALASNVLSQAEALSEQPTGVNGTISANQAAKGVSQWGPVSVTSNATQLQQSHELMTPMREQIRFHIEQKVKQAEIRLDPPELGKIELTVKLEGDKLQIHMQAANASVKEALQMGLDRLRAELTQDHGGAVEVDISHGEPNSNSSQTEQSDLIMVNASDQHESNSIEQLAHTNQLDLRA